MTEPIRTLIVDDEPLARERLRALLADRPAFAIVGECGNGADAVDALRTGQPELVFLDVQMPELDGFETAALIRERERTKRAARDERDGAAR